MCTLHPQACVLIEQQINWALLALLNCESSGIHNAPITLNDGVVTVSYVTHIGNAPPPKVNVWGSNAALLRHVRSRVYIGNPKLRITEVYKGINDGWEFSIRCVAPARTGVRF